MKNRLMLPIAVYLILEKDDKILFARRFQTGYEDGKYSLPAGHLEPGETLTDALVREAKEEIGIDIAVTAMDMVHVLHRSKHDDVAYIDFFFTVKNWQGEIKNNEPHKCDHLQWHSKNSFPDTTIDYIQHVLLCISNNKSFSEYWE